MIYNVGDIITEFLVRGNNTTTAGYYTDTIIRSWVDQSHKWVCGYKKWPFTEGRSSTTFASLTTNEDGYLTGIFPEGWRSDSIRSLFIGGKKVNKVNFYKFQKFIEDNPQSTERIFTDSGRLIIINPNIDLSGTVTAWGQYTPNLDTTDLTATTVFSNGEDEANEAIVEKMLSYAYEREKSPAGVSKGKIVSQSITHEQNAVNILERMWKNITDEQFGYQSTQDDGMFKRFDVLRGGFKEDLFKRDQFF